MNFFNLLKAFTKTTRTATTTKSTKITVKATHYALGASTFNFETDAQLEAWLDNRAAAYSEIRILR